MTIDAIATLPHYWAHLGPAWDALPEGVRGERLGPKPVARVSDAVIVAGYQDLMRARRLGYRRIAYLEHGIGQSYGNGNPAYPGGKGRDAVDLFLSPNETAGARDRAAYPKARVEVVGDPRLDTLPARVPDGRTTAAISWHWDASAALHHEGKPAYAHYRNVLGDVARSVNLIGHAHPRAAATMSRVYARLGIPFVADFDEVCRRADLFVADNSSTIYEFASTGRPVVLANAPWYRRNVQLGLRFWAAADVGLQVDEPEQLVPTVLAALDDRHRERREDALSIAYGHRSGAGQRASAVIVDWLAAAAAAA